MTNYRIAILTIAYLMIISKIHGQVADSLYSGVLLDIKYGGGTNSLPGSIIRSDQPTECIPIGSPAVISHINYSDSFIRFVPSEGKNDSGNVISDPVNEDIIVYWIHGLNGTVESWKTAALASQFGTQDGYFKPRKLTSVLGTGYSGTPYQPAYSEDYGIILASQEWERIATLLPTGAPLYPSHTQQDFIIAHSQRR